MTKRLQHVAPLQLGIVLATLYGIISLIVVPFMLIAMFVAAQSRQGPSGLPFGMIFMVFIPILYAIGGFIGGVIVAAIYNLIAKFTGGIEFTLEDCPPPAPVLR